MNNLRIWFVLTVLLTAIAFASLALAQGSGPNRSISSFEVKRTVTGTVSEVNSDEGYLLVADKDGKKYKFYLSEETKFKADKKTDLHDKKEIQLSDFKEGHTVKITYQPDGKKVFEVRLKRSEAKAS